MKYRISHIVPLRAAFIIAVLFAAIPAVFTSIALAAMPWMPHLGSSPNSSYVAMFLWTPAIHAGLGFAFGLIGSVIYNIIAKWTGGLEVEVRDLPPEL
jgi:hypothetical protein